MAAPNTNWVYERGRITDKDRQALDVVKKKEKENIKNGYRWVKINDRNRILVECDNNGNPTKAGNEKIKKFKEYMQIK